MLRLRYYLAIILLLVCGDAFATTEDFTSYATADPDGKLSVTASLIDSDNIQDCGGETRVEKNYTASHFGNYSINFKAASDLCGSVNGEVMLWSLGNTADAVYSDLDAANIGIALRGQQGSSDSTFTLINLENNSSDTYVGLNDTFYWFTCARDGSTQTCAIYSDTWGGTLVDTLSVTRTGTSYQYQTLMTNLGVVNCNGNCGRIAELTITQADSGGGGSSSNPTHLVN